MIPIEKQNRIDWNAIRGEYIQGGTSYRALADKYGLSKDAIARKAQSQHWDKDRDKVRDKVATKIIQKTADTVADNAAIAAEIKTRLLLRLQRIEERYPFDATEVRTHEGKNTVVFKLKDLTAAYRDLTDDLPKSVQDNNGPIMELLRRLDDECGI